MVKAMVIKALMLSFIFVAADAVAQNSVNLGGDWAVKLDPKDNGVDAQWYNGFQGERIKLPGTLDDAGLGERVSLDTTNLNKDVLIRLSRKNSYIGVAWFSKKIVIPRTWKGKSLQLYFERVLWSSRVWIDGKEIGSFETLSTPHIYEMAEGLQSGAHTITVRIDNRKIHHISFANQAHAYTEGTQIIWNGVLGTMQIRMRDKIFVDNIQVYGDKNRKVADLFLDLFNTKKVVEQVSLSVKLIDKQGGRWL